MKRSLQIIAIAMIGFMTIAYGNSNQNNGTIDSKQQLQVVQDTYAETMSSEKVSIETYNDLWNALRWENFEAKGMSSFLVKHEFKGQTSAHLRQLANDIINAAMKGTGSMQAKKARFYKAKIDAGAERTSKKRLEKLKELLM